MYMYVHVRILNCPNQIAYMYPWMEHGAAYLIAYICTCTYITGYVCMYVSGIVTVWRNLAHVIIADEHTHKHTDTGT